MCNRWARRERWIYGVCRRIAQTSGWHSSVVQAMILSIFIPGMRLNSVALNYLILSYLLPETVES
jgi:phage shock protein PspC (stress-responsive transcriptional regulator)